MITLLLLFQRFQMVHLQEKKVQKHWRLELLKLDIHHTEETFILMILLLLLLLLFLVIECYLLHRTLEICNVLISFIK